VASHRTQPSRRQRAIARAAVTIATGSCVVGLSALPTAQAAKTSTSASGTTTSVEVVTTPHGKRAEREAQAAESLAPAPVVAPAPAPVAGEQPVADRAKHAKPSAPPMGASVPVAGGAVGSAPGAQSRRPDREASPARARRRQEPAPAGETAAVRGDQAATVSGDDSSSSVESLARKQKKEKEKTKEKVKKEKGSEKSKEKKEKEKEKGGTTGKEAGENPGQTSGQGGGKAKKEAERESVDSTSSEGAGPDEPTASAASVLASTPSPAGGTGDASITSFAPPASVGVRAQRVAHAPRRHSAAHASRTAAVVAPGSATAAVPASPSSGAPAPSSPHAPATTQTHAAAAQPAIVKTITHIVGVVPTPVRFLIAALVALALALAVRSRLSSVRTRKLVRQRGQLLEDVGLLQAALLPVPPARLGPVGTTVAYRPADGPGAGGDFYDVFALEDGRLAVIVGDVSGHGREALPHTALVRFTVRAYLEAGLSPRKALRTAGGVLDRQLAGSFATVIVAVYHPRERTLTYSSAGHPPPVVLGDPREGDDAAYSAVQLTTACSAPPLGAGMHTGTRETVISVPGPARLCFHTDGVTEARIAGDLFGSERLTVALGELGREATAVALLDSVAERTDTRPDDMAACVLRIADGEGAPALRRELLELDGAAIASGRAERFLRESGMSPETAASTLDSARGELDRRDSVLLELSFGDGPPTATLGHDTVLHTAALALASAS
jgi:hypothetical protein